MEVVSLTEKYGGTDAQRPHQEVIEQIGAWHPLLWQFFPLSLVLSKFGEAANEPPLFVYDGDLHLQLTDVQERLWSWAMNMLRFTTTILLLVTRDRSVIWVRGRRRAAQRVAESLEGHIHQSRGEVRPYGRTRVRDRAPSHDHERAAGGRPRRAEARPLDPHLAGGFVSDSVRQPPIAKAHRDVSDHWLRGARVPRADRVHQRPARSFHAPRSIVARQSKISRSSFRWTARFTFASPTDTRSAMGCSRLKPSL